MLVTRPQHQAQSFIDEIKRLGGTTFHLPTIEIAYCTNTPELTDADLIIFTSVNAVIGAQLHKANFLAGSPSPLIASIGTATTGALHKAGVCDVIAPAQNANSESLLNLLEAHIFQNMKIVIIRGDSGRDALRDSLTELKTQVRYEQVYQRKLPKITAESAADLWQRANPHIVSISSDLGLVNLISLLPSEFHKQLFSCPLVVNSMRCEKKAHNAGFTAHIGVAFPPGDAGQISQLCKFAQLKRQANL